VGGATIVERAAVLTHGSGRFWSELVLFLASSDNMDIHAEMLKASGEFMT
jgi:hypothetical protein